MQTYSQSRNFKHSNLLKSSIQFKAQLRPLHNSKFKFNLNHLSSKFKNKLCILKLRTMKNKTSKISRLLKTNFLKTLKKLVNKRCTKTKSLLWITSSRHLKSKFSKSYRVTNRQSMFNLMKSYARNGGKKCLTRWSRRKGLSWSAIKISHNTTLL